jgi:hypothetical protein
MLAGPLIRDCFFRLLITVLRSTCKGNCSWSELYSNSGEEQVQQPASCVCVCVRVCVQRALVTHSIRLISYILPKYMFLNLPRDVICSTACFRPRVHTLRLETATWNQSFSTCDLCDANDIQDEQACSFPLRQSPCDFSRQKTCISVSPNRISRRVYFYKPEQQQEPFFLQTNCFLWAGSLLDWRPLIINLAWHVTTQGKC